jgi:chemotaxis protein CheD
VKVFLKPGELYVGEESAQVATILGSCVSVTMFSPRVRIGAICHALLPSGRAPEPFRYVDSAILHMLDTFAERGVRGDELEIKLIGGADVLEHPGSDTATVGRRNIETAMKILKERNLALAGSDVGGTMGRKVYFWTRTGTVLMKRIEKVGQGSLW